MTFLPKFVVSDSVAKTADLINRPHEDYPKRVDRTAELINTLIKYRYETVTKHELLQIHSKVMWDFNPRGQYRPYSVTVGASIPPSHLHVPEFMDTSQDGFPPLSFIDLISTWGLNPWLWYQRFESVHPFADGNGRVGGIILAWLTYSHPNSLMLAPCQ